MPWIKQWLKSFRIWQSKLQVFAILINQLYLFDHEQCTNVQMGAKLSRWKHIVTKEEVISVAIERMIRFAILKREQQYFTLYCYE